MDQISSNWCQKLGVTSSLAVFGAIAFSKGFALAQIKPDTTLGAESSVVTPFNPQLEQVSGGAIRGKNLFHSFQEFNVSEGRGVYFTNPTGIESILSRVTGDTPSSIFGKLGVLGNANLFLINPKGIIFGSKASLDVRGSFVATTANAIQFGNQGFFDASAPNVPPLLTVNPSALLFNQTATGYITNNSRTPAGKILENLLGTPTSLFGLRVPDGQSLLLVGGNVSLDGGGLNALGGRVELGGLAGAGTVGLDVNGNSLHLSFPNDVARADISLTNRARVDVTGEGSGNIQVQGRHVTLDRSTIFATTLGAKPGGDLTVTASESVELNGPGNPLTTQTIGTGNAGAMTITTGTLIVRNGAQVSTATSGEGSGGELTVTASDFVELTGKFVGITGDEVPSRLVSSTAAKGNAGNITITTGELLIQNGANLSAESSGVDNSSGPIIPASGAAGDLAVTARFIRFDNGVLSAMSSSGKGGNIKLQHVQDLQLRHNSELSTTAGGSGNGGNINIGTGTLVALEKSDITANARGGQGGNIRIMTQGLFRSPDSQITAISERGPQFSGTVQINTLVNNPSQGLVTLPVKPVDVTGQIAQGCPVGVGPRASKFVVTGRGGLPPDPTEALRSEPALADLGTTVQSQENRTSAGTSSNPTSSDLAPLVEAQGWVTNAKGEVVLVAQAPTFTLHIPWLTPTTCLATKSAS